MEDNVYQRGKDGSLELITHWADTGMVTLPIDSIHKIYSFQNYLCTVRLLSKSPGMQKWIVIDGYLPSTTIATALGLAPF